MVSAPFSRIPLAALMLFASVTHAQTARRNASATRRRPPRCSRCVSRERDHIRGNPVAPVTLIE